MDADTQKLIEGVHASSTQAVVVVAGGGAQAITWLLTVPGASRTVLEALVPYAPAALIEFLKYEPAQFVSVQTARDMARLAYQRAAHLRAHDNPVAGVAATAAMTTDYPKRGSHRCEVAAWTDKGVTTYSLELVKGLRDRPAEDQIVSMLVLRALAEAGGLEFDLPLDLDPREQVERHTTCYDDPIQALLAEHISSVTVHPDGRRLADGRVFGGILPGSFNPLHEGHRRLATVASAMLDSPVTFELSVANVDKPPLEEPEVRRRLAQFAGKFPVVLTGAPVFSQKARLFPGCTFVIGWDTAIRLVDPRYYGGEEYQMLAALGDIHELGCRFLVAGRLEDGVFHTLTEVAVPKGFREIFTPVPESAFRYDLSSTELRSAGRKL